MRELADAGEVNDALLQNQIIEAVAGGDVWISGAAVTPGSSATQAQLDVDGGEVRIGGAVVSIQPQTVTLDDGHNEYPRVDVIYADGTGNVTKETGIPQPVRPQEFPDGSTPEPFEWWTPGPAATVPGVPLACAAVSPGTTTSQPVGPDQLQNRRMTAIDATEFITDGEVIPAIEAADTGADPVQARVAAADRWDRRTYGHVNIEKGGETFSAVLEPDTEETRPFFVPDGMVAQVWGLGSIAGEQDSGNSSARYQKFDDATATWANRAGPTFRGWETANLSAVEPDPLGAVFGPSLARFVIRNEGTLGRKITGRFNVAIISANPGTDYSPPDL